MDHFNFCYIFSKSDSLQFREWFLLHTASLIVIFQTKWFNFRSLLFHSLPYFDSIWRNPVLIRYPFSTIMVNKGISFINLISRYGLNRWKRLFTIFSVGNGQIFLNYSWRSSTSVLLDILNYLWWWLKWIYFGFDVWWWGYICEFGVDGAQIAALNSSINIIYLLLNFLKSKPCLRLQLQHPHQHLIQLPPI